MVAGQDGFCGGQLGTAAGTTAKTICCKFICIIVVCFNFSLHYTYLPYWKLVTFNIYSLSFSAYKVPFNIRFISDLYETVSGTNEAGKTPNGFRLAYILKSC